MVNMRRPEQLSIPQLLPLPVSSKEVNLSIVWNILNRRKWVVFLSIFVFTGLSLFIAVRLPPVYTAAAVVTFNVGHEKVVDIQEVLPNLQPDQFVVRSEVDVISSRAMILSVINRLRLVDDPEFNPDLRPASRLTSLINSVKGFFVQTFGARPLPLTNPLNDEQDVQESVVNSVAAHLWVSNNPKSFTIDISFSSLDPNKARRIVNTFAKQYVADQLRNRFEANKRANDWLSDRIRELRQQVLQAERAVETLRHNFKLTEVRGTTITDQQLIELNTQFVLARAERTRAEARLRTLEQVSRSEASITTVGEVLDSPLIQRLREQEITLRRQEAELATRLGPRHPQIIEIRAEVGNLREKIDEEVKKIAAALANEVEAIRSKELSLQEAVTELERTATQSMQAEVQLKELQREADTTRSLYEHFLLRFKETAEQKNLGETSARIISEAGTPQHPSFPNKKLYVVMGLLIGALFGILSALLIERLDGSFRTSHQVEEVTGLTALGIVPALTGRKRRRPHDYLLERPQSSYSEAMIAVRAAIAATHWHCPPKIIAVTSAVPKEGKSTFCASFGRLSAKSGRKVLIIDCDLRRPSIASLFGDAGKDNLTDFLLGSETFDRLTKIDPESNLHYIAASAYRGNPSDLLASAKMGALIRLLAAHYDLILIDTPPIMAVSDAALLANLADACLFLIKWADTSRSTVLHSVQKLTMLNVNLTGVVLSHVDTSKYAKYGFTDYSRQYGSYYEA